MLKKLLCLLLVCAMLVPLSPIVTVTAEQETPSIEEILNNYHAQAFAAQAQGERSAAAYSRRSGSDSQTLEEEAVDQLTAAGYDAFNVTTSNYTALEDELQTDFAEMGLDPEGSYIVVVSGEEDDTANSNGARVANPPAYEDYDGGGSTTFTYTYEGTTYLMRYVTVTSDNSTALAEEENYLLSEFPRINLFAEDLLNATLSLFIDGIAELPLSTVCSLVGTWTTGGNLTIVDPDNIIIRARTDWTREYIQVWNSAREVWYTAQLCSYAVSSAQCIGGFIYDSVTQSHTPINGPIRSTTSYSVKYHQKTQRKIDAITAYLRGLTNYDYVGNIHFYFVSDDGSINFNQQSSPLFTHTETRVILLSLEEEG